jgi:hypothetical protein
MKKALLIGINYKSIPTISLNGCIDDTINMRNMLIDAYGYESSNIVMLRDDNPTLFNPPTKNNIIQQLQQLALQSSKLEEVWIHYSGHGSQINQIGTDEPTGMDQVIIPIDYKTNGVIIDYQLLSIIKNIKCRAILLFDSCHSGTVCDLPWSFQCTTPTTYARTKNNAVVITNPNIFMISGCKDTQTSADTYSQILIDPVGAFTNAFIECLRNSQHNVSIMLLYRDVCANLAQAGFTQVPLLSSSSMNPNYVLSRSVALNSKNANPKYSIVAATSVVKTIMKSIIYK